MSNCIVCYTNNGDKCEIICKPETVSQYRSGKIGLKDTLLSDGLYRDAKKGDIASREQLCNIFCVRTSHGDDGDVETSELPEHSTLLDIVLRQGNYSMSTNELRAIKDQSFRAVVGYVKKTYTDAKGMEYSHTQIETALQQCKLNVDTKKDAAHNFLLVKKKIESILVLKPKPGDIPYNVHVSWAQHAKVYGRIKKYLVTEKKSEDGYDMELMVPSAEFSTVSAMF